MAKEAGEKPSQTPADRGRAADGDTSGPTPRESHEACLESCLLLMFGATIILIMLIVIMISTSLPDISSISIDEHET